METVGLNVPCSNYWAMYCPDRPIPLSFKRGWLAAARDAVRTNEQSEATRFQVQPNSFF